MSVVKKTLIVVMLVALTAATCWCSIGSTLETIPAELKHNLTRAAWARICPNGSISYSYTTLEGYNKKNIKNGFFITTKDCAGDVESLEVEGSAEGRSIFSLPDDKILIGTSLDPMLIVFDAKAQKHKILFRGDRRGMWLHQIFADANHAYIKLSAETNNFKDTNKIHKINLNTAKSASIEFNCRTQEQGYGGVQTVDPLGRIWFFSAYPVRYYWITPESGCAERSLGSISSGDIVSWIAFDDNIYYIVRTDDRSFKYYTKDGREQREYPHITNILPADLWKAKGTSIDSDLFVNLEGELFKCNSWLDPFFSELRPRSLARYAFSFAIMRQ